MSQIDKNTDIHQNRIESAKHYDEMRHIISDLKKYSKSNRKDLTRAHTDMIHQDEGQKDKLIQKMKAIEDENQSFKY